MSDKELVPYGAVAQEVFSFFGNIAFSAEQNKYISENMTQHTHAIVNDKCSVEEFCKSIFKLMEEMHSMSLKIPEAILTRWYTSWDGTIRSKEDRESPLESGIFLLSSFIDGRILTFKPQVADSPAFHEFVRKVISDSRFGTGRTGFIAQLLPKTKISDKIDFVPFLKDKRYAGRTILALLKMKDGRFVKEAEEMLEEDPKNFYRGQIKLYIDRYRDQDQETK